MDRLSYILSLISLLAPLSSSAIIAVIPKKYSRLISTASLVCASTGFTSGVLLLIKLWDQGPSRVAIKWFTAGSISFTADLAIANPALVMLVVVAFISLLVHLYSTLYMEGDADWKRYFAMLGFFTFAMQGIVLSDNLLFLFIFWELVGFSSYMLIGHWTTRFQAGSAAAKAFIMNRIGDLGFLIGLMIIWTTHDTFSLTTIIGMQNTSGWDTAAALCIFCGVIGKSAQFPLFTWLPDAMEGPTPVSALIHAATMVAAGVYLLVRTFVLFTPDALVVVAFIGMITTLIGALAALSQYDIKKVLAYSTMSQLGLMILALGMGAVDAAFLHLLTHAFFKACLFLSAGSIIHSLHKGQGADAHFDVQDIRNMGGLKKSLPVTFAAFLVSAASLAGIPFFSGFLSKEAMLTALFVHTNMLSWLMIVTVLATSFLTVMYSFRLIWFIFFGEARAVRSIQLSEAGWEIRLPIILLAIGSLWFVVSPNPFDFAGWLNLTGTATPSHSLSITIFSVLWVLLSLFVSWYIFRKMDFRTSSVLRNAFHIDHFYAFFLGRTVGISTRTVDAVDRRVIDRSIHAFAYLQLMLAHVVSWIDRTFVDGTVNVIAQLTGTGGKITKSIQGGNIQLYIFWSVFAIIIFIISTLK